MKFKFCGDADCPDWVLAEINDLSKISSVKLKQLAQVVAQGIIHPPIKTDAAEKIFADSKLDVSVNLKACIACLTHILTSAVRFNCDSNALNSELQQLGLPREHSTSIRKVTEEHSAEIRSKLKAASLSVNRLENVTVTTDSDLKCANVTLTVDGTEESVLMTPFTVNVLLEELHSVRSRMIALNKNVLYN